LQRVRNKLERNSVIWSMSTVRKLAIGIGVASGALLAAWLLTGDRKKKTKDFILKKTADIKNRVKTEKSTFDDSEAHYV
jgi:hypothetical protein